MRALILTAVLALLPVAVYWQTATHEYGFRDDYAHLRESHEEVGLDPAQVQVLGTISDYVTGTAFVVTPVVGLVSPDHTITPNPNEVASVFEVPLAFLMNPAFHQRHALEAEGRRREWFSMPYQDGEDLRFIWGATAGMIRNFYRFLMA